MLSSIYFSILPQTICVGNPKSYFGTTFISDVILANKTIIILKLNYNISWFIIPPNSHSLPLPFESFEKIKKYRHPNGYLYFMAPQIGLEPMTPSVRNIVALLAWSASHCSVFLPLLGLLHLPQAAQACEAVNSRRVVNVTVSKIQVISE